MSAALLLLAGAAAAATPFAGLRQDIAARRLSHEASLKAAQGEKERFVLRLAQMREIDQLARGAFERLPSGPARPAAMRELDAILVDADTRHTAELKLLLEKHGWPRRDAYPPRADDDAWILVQHADRDLPFQKRVLAMLETLKDDGGSTLSHYGYLYDRVAVAEKRPQLYGTQGRCEDGRWVPEPIAEEAGVEARRRAAGMMSLAENVERLRPSCEAVR